MRSLRLSCLIISVSVFLAEAQWVSQDIVLSPGWNSVYLPFQPVPASCEQFFAGVPVESVLWWCRTAGSAEFQSDLNDPYLRGAFWRKWVPDDPDVTSFGELLAGESYQVILSAATNVTLHVQGTAVLVKPGWLTDEYNFVGFPVPDNAVTFGTFLSFTDKLLADSLQEVLADGSVASIFRPATVSMTPGKAYWVKCGPLATVFAGPIRLGLGTSSKRMDFSGQWHPQTLRIINETAVARTVTVRHLASEVPPPGTAPLAGKTPLLMEVPNWTPGHLGTMYVPLPDTFVTNVAANTVLSINLMPRIAAMTGGAAGSAWQSVLRVSDEGNAENAGGAIVCHQVGVYCDTPDAASLDPSGLWVGSVSVTGVSRAPAMAGVSNGWDATAPVAVTRPYTFRVLLHRDSTTNNPWRLLQQAYLATDTNGADLVFTDAFHAKTFAADHPECAVTRLSSANLPLIDPLPLLSDGTNLTVTVTLPHNDPVNPFVHPFHPQHDNKEVRNGVASPLADGQESYSVRRAMTFTFTETDAANPGNPEWNISEAGGTFTEAVDGLNKTIYVSGPFTLARVSRAGVLTGLKLNDPTE